ncbi:hypothetical protein CSOJ01_16022 [Colletotrichum sojae]|uniref:Uncharacterized protein n=1 Tax=Colletotrichum sojae TaxID=2175907 RepID=A0A8H6MFM6_9PEZI|nr:hypothetical protein CSOJ01_16022 [Colletotrichum sojae]
MDSLSAAASGAAASDIIDLCLMKLEFVLDEVDQLKANGFYPIEIADIARGMHEVFESLGQLFREPPPNLPDYADIAFVSTIEQIDPALDEISKILAELQKQIPKWKFQMMWPSRQSRLADARGSMRRSAEALRLVVQIQHSAVIRNATQTAKRLKLDLSLFLEPQEPTHPQGSNKLQKGAPGDGTKRTFMFPTNLKFVDQSNFLCRYPINQADFVGPEELFTEIKNHKSLVGQVTEQSIFHAIICGFDASKSGRMTFKDKYALDIPHNIIDRCFEEFTFRLPRSEHEDWTMGMFVDNPRQAIKVFIHGMRNEEREEFAKRICKARRDIRHPVLLPVIMCEMMSAGDLFDIRTTTNELQNVEYRTRLSGVIEEDRAGFKEMTGALNRAISSLPTHEARIEVNILLTNRILEVLLVMEESYAADEEQETPQEPRGEWSVQMKESAGRLKSRLQARTSLLHNYPTGATVSAPRVPPPFP